MISEYTNFTSDELQHIDEADDLKIAPFRADGKTYGTPTWIWEVIVDGDLYVRAFHGKNGRWYRSAIQQKAGCIYAAGMVKDVIFEPVEYNEDLLTRIDEAYKTKYRNSPYLNPMVSNRAKEATVKINPKI
ncbi:DUF2255 family protein [Membranihabitans maritimus]|uniref:DUF2255 family protein n=1 Tax=Membranihabitans maritimus TaxID=2904244 RepID=UPI001F173B54|nr:DUF2255 family protein [Membranihabitans maritimus]